MLWSEFLECARRYARGSTEADWRSAISRSYYAIFHRFKDWLRLHGVKLGGSGQAHSNLYFGLANCGFAGMQRIGQQIDNLRTDRTNADYELGKVVNIVNAQSALDDADAILADFDAILQVVPPRQIADGAKNYLISIGRITNTP